MCLCRISISKVSPYQKKTISSYAKLNFWINQPKHEVTLLNFHWWNVWKVDKLWFTTLQNILNAKLRHQRLIKMVTIISHYPGVNFKSCSLYCGLGYCQDWPISRLFYWTFFRTLNQLELAKPWVFPKIPWVYLKNPWVFRKFAWV